MSVSRTKHPQLRAFGGALRWLHKRYETRLGRPFSHDAIARLVRRGREHLRFGGPTLWRWEEGEVSSPDPLVIQALAQLYDVEHDALLSVLNTNRSNRHLTAEDGERFLGGYIGSTPPSAAAEGQDPQLHADTANTLVDVAADLAAAGERLQRLAEAILGGHAPIARDRKPELAQNHPTVRRAAARATRRRRE